MTSTFFCANEPWSHHLKLQSIGNKINTSEWSHWDQDEKKNSQQNHSSLVKNSTLTCESTQSTSSTTIVTIETKVNLWISRLRKKAI